jgi:uncharacterized coiled-coil protein SlyX
MYDNIFYEADRNEDRLLIEEMKDTIAERDATIADLQETVKALQQQLANK